MTVKPAPTKASAIRVPELSHLRAREGPRSLSAAVKCSHQGLPRLLFAGSAGVGCPAAGVGGCEARVPPVWSAACRAGVSCMLKGDNVLSEICRSSREPTFA